MSVGKWQVHNALFHRMGEKKIDLSTDTLRAGLADSNSNVSGINVVNYASVTGELPTLNGYIRTGKIVSATWNLSGPTASLDIEDVVWTATGGDLTARYIFLYDFSDSNKTVLAHSLLDDTPADVIATNGNTLTGIIDGAGVLKVN